MLATLKLFRLYKMHGLSPYCAPFVAAGPGETTEDNVPDLMELPLGSAIFTADGTLEVLRGQ